MTTQSDYQMQHRVGIIINTSVDKAARERSIRSGEKNSKAGPKPNLPLGSMLEVVENNQSRYNITLK